MDQKSADFLTLLVDYGPKVCRFDWMQNFDPVSKDGMQIQMYVQMN